MQTVTCRPLWRCTLTSIRPLAYLAHTAPPVRRYLSISNAGVATVDANAFDGLASLDALDLSENRLEVRRRAFSWPIANQGCCPRATKGDPPPPLPLSLSHTHTHTILRYTRALFPEEFPFPLLVRSDSSRLRSAAVRVCPLFEPRSVQFLTKPRLAFLRPLPHTRTYPTWLGRS